MSPAPRPRRSKRSWSASGAHSLVALRNGLLCAVSTAPARLSSERARRRSRRIHRRQPSAERRPIELARRVRTELRARFGEVRAAASRPAPTHNLRRSFHEARCALEAVRLANGAAPDVASYKDLGAFQLLLSLQDDDALVSYCQSVLGPVESDEGEYGDELLRSLDVFIENNGHWERAAQALYCHRHTLRYRIKRVEQLTGRDFTQRARPHRVLAGAARTGAGAMTPVRSGFPTRDQARRVPRRDHPGRRARAVLARTRGARSRPARALAARSHDEQFARPGRDDRGRRRRRVFAGAELILKVKEPQPSEVALLRRGPDAVHLPAPRGRARAGARACGAPAPPASPTRRSRTPTGACRCSRR